MARPADPHARTALVTAARAEFARRGLRGARIEDITAACGLSKGAFYLHFPSKEALFGEVVGAFQAGLERVNARRMEAMERFLSEHGVPGPRDRRERSERYQRLIGLEAAHDLEAMELVWAYRDVSLVLLSGSQGTEFESFLWQVTDTQVARVARDFQRLQEAGAVDRELDPELFGSVIVGAYLLLSKQMARLKEKPDLAAWARTLQRLCQEGTMPQLDDEAPRPPRAASARTAEPVPSRPPGAAQAASARPPRAARAAPSRPPEAARAAPLTSAREGNLPRATPARSVRPSAPSTRRPRARAKTRHTPRKRP
ncbi:TetR/AcrR family transcriptional regulator [Pyxidicoccus xibeiensis]|uniref:TetR/AcrR family transcriptional regulator n=1 Tax=Pyxidicoccus xibeiensis TaxID=2906759 RepID=UPI00225DF966|nr:TetR/AcrR family transcriptional regulator [Pyxidicoccus xibeiensis]